MTRIERGRARRRRQRQRQARAAALPEWLDDEIRAAHLRNQSNAKLTMRSHDRKCARRRQIEKAICIPRIADQLWREWRDAGFADAEAFFRAWLSGGAR